MHQVKKNEIEFYIFCLGLFLLPSAFSLSSIFLLLSNTITTIKFREIFFKDRINIVFLFSAIFLVVSAIFQTLFLNKNVQFNFDTSLTWIGLFNWIPLFWCFWCFKHLLKTYKRRRLCGILLLIGSFPVVLTGIGQSFFDWDGPFQTLNGLIIWYQRPIDGITGLTGLFNNPNYAGAWLNFIWPISLACLIESKENLFKKISIYFFIFGISISTILTNSRAAWLGIIFGGILIYGKKSLKLLVAAFLIISLFALTFNYQIEGGEIQQFYKIFIPKEILEEFTNFQYSRLDIWKSAINALISNPIFGTGASSFTKIYEFDSGLWKGHAHNLALELLVSYGIPAGLLVVLPILFICYKSTKISFINQKVNLLIFDKAWVSSLLILILSQMVDVQYFDGRISILFWLTLSVCSNLINEDKLNQSIIN